jgi:protein-tyrosine phosphatase
LLEVRPEYLEAAFEAIGEHYGSFENYLDQGLGIDEPTVQRLRTALLD